MHVGENHEVNVDFLKIPADREGGNFVCTNAFKGGTAVNQKCFFALANQETAGTDTFLFAQLNNKIFTAGQMVSQILVPDLLHGSFLPLSWYLSYLFNCRRARQVVEFPNPTLSENLELEISLPDEFSRDFGTDHMIH